MLKNQLFTIGWRYHAEFLLGRTEAAYAAVPPVDSALDARSSRAMHADLGHGFLRAVFGDVVTRLNFANDLQIGALGQSNGVFGRAAESDALVPRGLRFTFTGLAVFPSTLGRE
jgi:hypothetical protein